MSIVVDEPMICDGLPALDTPPLGVAAERIVDALGDADFSRALQSLIDARGARGATLAEWDGRREPRVLASAGAPGATADQLDLCRFFIDAWRRRANGPLCVTATIHDDAHYACAAFARPGRDLLTLVVWSDRVQSSNLSLLRLFLRIVDPLRPHRVRRVASVQPAHSDYPEDYVIGPSRAMQELHRQMRLVVRNDVPMLMIGETGTGKERIARIVHSWSDQRRGPFVSVNCATISENALLTQLRQAEGGTLFLDEIGELVAPLQVRLLRAMQSPLDLRIIAASTTDLDDRRRTGEFRSDLFFRIAGAVLRVPPLRERAEDIPALVEFFVKRESIAGISTRALEVLAHAPWPGNVRELENELRRLALHCTPGQAIESAHLSEALLLGARPTSSSSLDLAMRGAEVERHTIRQAMLRAHGNRSVAARLLGISRNGLALKMQRLEL